MTRYGYWIALLILVAAPYTTGLRHEFVYDDHGSIVENPFLDDRDCLKKLLRFQTITDASVPDGRRPVVVLSYLLDRAVWGLRPAGFHATNLLLHLGVVLLLAALARRLQPELGPFPGFAAALLYGLHPVLTEAVQCPAFREDLLVTLFLLLSLLAATRARTAWLSVPALIAALASKESAAVTPILMLWMWFCFPATRLPRKLATTAAAVTATPVIVFAVLWLNSGPLQASSSEHAAMALAYPANLMTVPWLWLKQVLLLLVPHPLIVDHVIMPVTQFTDWRFLSGAAAVVACGVLAMALPRRAPWIAFGVGWMLISFVPVSNIVPLHNPFAERYVYLTAVGFCLLAARLLSLTPERETACGSAQPGAKTCIHRRALLLALICMTCTGLTVRRLADWADDSTLWSRTLLQEPRSARAHTWMGLGCKRAGEFEKALQHFTEADRLNPLEVSGLINIAVLHGQQGRFAEAEALLREAIRRRPDKPDAHWNLAVALDALGRKDEAMAEVQQTLRLDPRYPAAVTLMTQPAPESESNP